MTGGVPDHYATLGLDRDCTSDEIRKAYRFLAKQHHPDVNGPDACTADKIHAINDAYRVLSDPASREAYDGELGKSQSSFSISGRGVIADIKEDVFLDLKEFITGATREITVKDPANPDGPEVYELAVPEETAPGAKFRIRRGPPFENGHVIARVKPWPDARFKVKGADLKCDLNIYPDLAESGGTATVTGVLGDMLDIEVPAHCPRGETIRVEGEGLPRAHGGRGDLQVRIMYRPQVRTRRSSSPGARPLRRRLG